MSAIGPKPAREISESLQSIEIVETSPGAGFKIILHMTSPFGEPFRETCEKVFPTLAEADSYAAREYGIPDAQVYLGDGESDG